MRIRVICKGNFKDGAARYVAQRLALKQKIKGFAKKDTETSMILELEGEESSISNLLEEFIKGNSFYSVNSYDQEVIEDISTEKFFSIK